MSKTLGVVAGLFMVACGGGSGGDSLYCVFASGTTSQTCYGETKLDSAQRASEAAACTQGQGTEVSQCPTASLVGVCTVPNDGFSVENYVYQGAVADDMTACADNGGTWSTTP